MEGIEEQRVCVKFCFKLGKSSSETFELLQQAFGNDVLSWTTCFEWFKRFKEGRTSVKDNERPGRPSTSKTNETVARVREIIRNNHRLTIREVAEDVGIYYGSCQEILTKELGMSRIAAKFVPRLLTDEQKQNRKTIAQELFERSESDQDFLKNIITVHREWVPQGQTVNQHYYLEVMKRLRENVRKKRPDSWKSGSWMLHHDNAPAHSSLLIRQFLAKNQTPVVPQPPYSPDLAPCDFFLFPKLKSTLKGRRFQTIDDIKQNTEIDLKDIPISAYQECFQKWKRRWQRCIDSQGDYFEGMTELCTSDRGAYDTVHMIMALPLIPGNKINKGFTSIQIFYEENIKLTLSNESQEKFETFFQYYRTTWLTGVYTNMLSVSGTVWRTNNVLEISHQHLKMHIGSNHQPEPR
ncbi:protein GVQW3-like, partial [Aphis craccivora]